MTPAQFFAKWDTELETLRRRGALVNGAEFCAELLSDVRAVLEAEQGELLTLTVAAAHSGYSADYLGSLIRQGKIANAGRPHAPRIRRVDLPRKASRLRSLNPSARLIGATPGQIARAVVDSERGAAR
jgi:hypothetical protein